MKFIKRGLTLSLTGSSTYKKKDLNLKLSKVILHSQVSPRSVNRVLHFAPRPGVWVDRLQRNSSPQLMEKRESERETFYTFACNSCIITFNFSRSHDNLEKSLQYVARHAKTDPTYWHYTVLCVCHLFYFQLIPLIIHRIKKRIGLSLE